MLKILGLVTVIIVALLGFISFTLYQINQELVDMNRQLGTIESRLGTINTNVYKIRHGL